MSAAEVFDCLIMSKKPWLQDESGYLDGVEHIMLLGRVRRTAKPKEIVQ